MKIYTSYFYQIRFFPENLIPLSTAAFDPKWYSKNAPYIDKRGVICGLRAEPFMPRADLDCDCMICDHTHSATCKFLRQYYLQLLDLDFEDIMRRFERIGNYHKSQHPFEGDPEIALIFHEAKDNPCSERWPVQRWFKQHGVIVPEWEK